MSTPRRVALTVSYDGTDFCGWQLQAPGVRTVQGELIRALEKVLGHEVELEGSSRTDAGVHSLGQVAALDCDGPIPTERLPQVINSSLPQDLRVRSARDVPLGFEPRYESIGKVYRYAWFLGPRPETVLLHRFAEKWAEEVDLEAMRLAAQSFVGVHDFSSFQNVSKDPPQTSVREIFAVDVRREGPLLLFEVAGGGFLYKMVRNLAGTLLDIGTGRQPVSFAKDAIDARDRQAGGPTAAARGLCLLGVYFDRDELDRNFPTESFLQAWID